MIFSTSALGMGQTTTLAKLVSNVRVFVGGLVSQPADVQSGQIAHRKGTHREAEIENDPVDLLGHRVLQKQIVGLPHSGGENPIAHEPTTHPHDNRNFSNS